MRVYIKNILKSIIFNIYYKKKMNIIISLYFEIYIIQNKNQRNILQKKTEYK